MRIIIFGLGSIGLRHLKILNDLYKFEIYAFRSGKGSSLINSPPVVNHGICQVKGIPCKLIYDWKVIDRIKPDIAIISNPTFLHIETAIKCIQHEIKYLFIEKPLDCRLDRLDELLKLVNENKTTAYVAYPFRHHPEIQKLKKPYRNQWIYFVCHSDFRKWRDYKTYSHGKEQGGGCLLELSHEVDIARYLLGPIKSIINSLPTIFDATLDLDTECWLRIEHCNRNLSFHNLNILTPTDKRFLKFKDGEKIEYGATDEMYERQLTYFISNLDNPNLENNIFEAAEVFRKLIEFKKKEGQK